jgi:hypothetical protein
MAGWKAATTKVRGLLKRPHQQQRKRIQLHQQSPRVLTRRVMELSRRKRVEPEGGTRQTETWKDASNVYIAGVPLSA